MECPSQAPESPQGRVRFAGLNLGNEGAVESAALNEGLLCPVPLLSQLLESHAERALDGDVLEGCGQAVWHPQHSGHEDQECP